MRKKISKKLTLTKESIRTLADHQLGGAVGGRIPIISIDEPTCVGKRCYSVVNRC